MPITIELRPEVEAELARQAAANGLPLEVHAASLLAEAAHVPAEGSAAESRPAPGSLADLFAPVRGLFADGELDFSRRPTSPRPVDFE